MGTKKSVKRVLFLLLCLVVTFILQNVILSNLKNTLLITSSAQMFTLNFVICLLIFAILLAISKQPRQTHRDSPIKSDSSILGNNRRNGCLDSRLFCTSLFCCCYCCFNFPEEDDIHFKYGNISHNFRRTFLLPI